jgi:hypothetical protein
VDDPEPWDSATVHEEPIEIGYELAPNDPWGWEPDDTSDGPIEIGEVLDVGGPMEHTTR